MAVWSAYDADGPGELYLPKGTGFYRPYGGVLRGTDSLYPLAQRFGGAQPQLEKWETNYSFIYTGERYTSQANIPVNYQQPWYTSDFSVAHRLDWGPGELKVTLEVNNLFNQQYEVVTCYPMPGINFKCIVQYSF